MQNAEAEAIARSQTQAEELMLKSKIKQRKTDKDSQWRDQAFFLRMAELLKSQTENLLRYESNTVEPHCTDTRLTRTPRYNGQFCLSRWKAHWFFLITRLLQTTVNKDNVHFSVSKVTNSYRSSTLFHGHCLHGHCTLSIVINTITVLPYQAGVGQLVSQFLQFKAKSWTFSNESIALWIAVTVTITEETCYS